MSHVMEEDGDLDWKAIIDLLRDGKVAEIPCEKERDYIRRGNQVTKRAEKKGVAVEVQRGDGVLRVEPRRGVDRDLAAPMTAAPEFRGERQQERQQGREALRAEPAAEQERDG